MNQIILRGRLTDAPEVRMTAEQTSTTIARFSLAVQDRSHRNHSGDYDVDFIKCVAFNSLADVLSQYTIKGSELLVTGRLHTYSYKNKEDKTVYMSEVILEHLEFIAGCTKADISIPDLPDEETPFR